MPGTERSTLHGLIHLCIITLCVDIIVSDLIDEETEMLKG